MDRELYFSVDVEADGPIPGEYSMSSMGICVAGIQGTNERFRGIDPELHTFYVEIAPIPEASWNAEAAAVSGLDREALITQGVKPATAMYMAKAWVEAKAKEFEAMPIYVAYPLSFDWVFTHYYWERFAGSDPFSFSNCVDMKSMFFTKSGFLLTNSTKRNMPKHIKTKRRHTHNALDDAKGQADLFANLMTKEL